MNFRGNHPLGYPPVGAQRPAAPQYGAPSSALAAAYDAPGSVGAPLFPAYSRLFVDARRVLGLTEYELARRLGTEGRVVLALEQARFEYLPAWPETVRVVSAYLQGLGMDPRPVLHALAQDIERRAAFVAPPPAAPTYYAAVGQMPQAAGTVPAAQAYESDFDDDEDAPRQGRLGAVRETIGAWRMALSSGMQSAVAAIAPAARFRVARLNAPAAQLADSEARPRNRRKVRRTVLGVGAPLVAALAVANADIVRSAASVLPKPVTRALASAADQVRTQFAPVRDGLRWIEVEDPRSRRGDKLQTARR